jgi:hypothetical protein
LRDRQDFRGLYAFLHRFVTVNHDGVPSPNGTNFRFPVIAREAVRTLFAGGVINGKPGNIFDPAGKAARAEVAALLHRFIEAVR